MGRIHEIQKLCKLERSYALVGPRTIGKTSLVHQAYNELSHREPPELAIRVEFSPALTELDLVAQIVAELIDKHGAPPVLQHRMSGPNLQRFLARFVRGFPSKCGILFLDEADEVPARCPRLASALRHLHDLHQMRLVFVGFKQLRKAVNDAQNSFLMNVFEEEPARDLSLSVGTVTQAARHQIQYECAQLSLVFSSESLIRDVATNGKCALIRGKMVRDLDGDDLLAQAIVDCACDHLGYARARFFKYSPALNALVSLCSRGLEKEENRSWFAEGKVVQSHALVGSSDGLGLLLEGQPRIIIAKDKSEERLPLYAPTLDSHHRQVIAIAQEDPDLIERLEKQGVSEWIDIPLVAEAELLANLTVDQKGTQRRLGLQDTELLGWFDHWAAEAYAQVLAIERARQAAALVRDVSLLYSGQGLENLAWEFLVNITLEGEPGVHRAVLFLRQPQTGYMRGFLCHGAGSGEEWSRVLPSLDTASSRLELLESARRARARGLGASEEARLRALRNLRIVPADWQSPFAQALRTRRLLRVERADETLDWLFQALQWESTRQALICPLMHDKDCEGLLYVDKAFTGQAISNEEGDLLESLSLHVAAVVRPLRLGEELRTQVLGVSHTLISPMSSVLGLAEAMREASEPKRKEYLDLLMCEADRAARKARTLLHA